MLQRTSSDFGNITRIPVDPRRGHSTPRSVLRPYSICQAKFRRRGQSLVETALLVPFVFFLFLGLTNFGFFCYAFITVGHAAEVGASYIASAVLQNSQPAACDVILRDMQSLPNVPAVTTCNAAPLQVAVTQNYQEPATGEPAAQVKVTYDTIQLFPLPFMSGKMTINRWAVAILRN